MKKFSIQRRKDRQRADGTAPLYSVLYFERSKLRIPLGISVTEKEWDPVAEKVRGRSKEAQDKNLIVANCKAKITEIQVKARLNGTTLTRENFLTFYRLPGESTNFIDFIKTHLHELRDSYQPETMRHHHAALKKLEAFNPNLTLGEITPEWLQAYARFLRKHHGNNPGTIRKNMCVIRMHYYAAMRAGKVTDNPFTAYKLPAASPEVVYLTEEELNKLTTLYNEATLPENEQKVLRFFLFMTFTAMHISDARALQIEQIRNGEIKYRRIKTQTLVQMPIGRPAAQLIKYYRGKRMRGNLFQELPTDQAFNRVIKRICGRLGIDKPVSAKAARHTFATLYYKRNHGDIGTLSKLLGHSSINTTMIYAHIMEESRVDGVAAFDDLL